RAPDPGRGFLRPDFAPVGSSAALLPLSVHSRAGGRSDLRLGGPPEWPYRGNSLRRDRVRGAQGPVRPPGTERSARGQLAHDAAFVHLLRMMMALGGSLSSRRVAGIARYASACGV